MTFGCATAVNSPPAGIDADDWISAEVRRVLAEDSRVDASSINVETRDRVVVLAGIAASLDEVRRALRLVGRVAGVEQVVNRIRIVAGISGPVAPGR